jgi:hypothetical protein
MIASEDLDSRVADLFTADETFPVLADNRPALELGFADGDVALLESLGL